MTEILMTKQVTKEMEDRYIEIPFDMPPSVNTLEVSYEIVDKGTTRSIVDLGIRDEKRVRGWSGGARKHFYISKEKATPGYLPGPLTPGKWAVLLGTYRIAKAGCEVKVNIRFQLAQSRWYKGDLHTHTVHSDGKYELQEVVQIAGKIGLDFVALTDHNTITQNLVYPKENELTFIPGMELTTNHGHCNFLGVIDPVLDFRSTSDAQVLERILEAKKNGAFVVLNHPHCPYCPWEWSFDVPYDAVEIWNGPWRESNQHTLDWWQNQLVQGRKIVAVGGSDVHAPHPYVKHGHPTTWIYSKGKDASSLLSALGRGHVFITYFPVAPIVSLCCEDKMMGDTVVNPSDSVTIDIQGLQINDVIRIYTRQGKTYESIAAGPVWKKEFLSKQSGFVRVEVWRKFTGFDVLLPVTITNPLYIEKKAHSFI